MNTKTRRIAYLALLAALTLVLGYFDAMIPLPVTIPGIKLGLANITVLIALYLMGPRYSFVLMLMKVLMTSLIVGSPSMIMYSFSGSMLAYGGMWLLWKTNKVNLFAVSIVMSVLHNLGQITVAAAILATPAVFLNLPIMVIAACITGAITATIATGVLKALPPLAEKGDHKGTASAKKSSASAATTDLDSNSAANSFSTTSKTDGSSAASGADGSSTPPKASSSSTTPEADDFLETPKTDGSSTASGANSSSTVAAGSAVDSQLETSARKSSEETARQLWL